jgi:hypothetical protein
MIRNKVMYDMVEKNKESINALLVLHAKERIAFGLRSNADIEALRLKHTAVHDEDIVDIAIQAAAYIELNSTHARELALLVAYQANMLAELAADQAAEKTLEMAKRQAKLISEADSTQIKLKQTVNEALLKLTAEKVAALAKVTAEKVAALAKVTAEKVAALAKVTAEKVAALAKVNEALMEVKLETEAISIENKRISMVASGSIRKLQLISRS